MRQSSSVILLTSLAIGGVATGVLTRQIVFFLLAGGATVLLALSRAGACSPVSQSLRSFAGQVVDVELWGHSPTGDTPELVLESVNTLGAGLHVYFRLAGARTAHLKVAQPAGITVAAHLVTIQSARYVQWQRTRLPLVEGALALSIKRRNLRADGGALNSCDLC